MSSGLPAVSVSDPTAEPTPVLALVPDPPDWTPPPPPPPRAVTLLRNYFANLSAKEQPNTPARLELDALVSEFDAEIEARA